MSLAEAISEGLQVTGIGLIIVFSVLVILMLVMMAMKAIFYKPNKKDKTKEPSEKVETAPISDTAVDVTTVPVPAAADSGIDEGTLLAVITAAVAAVMDTPASRLNIKSYRRIGDNAPAWNKAGVRDIIDSRF